MLEPWAPGRVQKGEAPQGIQGTAMAGVRMKQEAELGKAVSTHPLMSELCLVPFTQQLSRWNPRLRQGEQVTQPVSYGVQVSLLQGNREHSHPAVDSLRLQELWHGAGLESALVCREPRTSSSALVSPVTVCPPCGPGWWPCTPTVFRYCSCIPRVLCRDRVQHCADWSDEYICPGP